MRPTLPLLSAIATTAILAACSVETASTGTGSYTHHPSSSGSGGSSGGGANAGTPSGSGSGGATAGGSSGGTTTNGGSSGGGATSGATITADETWASGKQLAASVTIAPGVTVTVANGATITAAAGVTITVQGTLKATAGATHAKITGASWGGVAVAKGGALSADSLDLENATTALDVLGTAELDDATITAATTPFKIEQGGSLTTQHVNVVGTKGMSIVNGTMTASHLDYDSGGNEGLSIMDPAASFTATNSVFHGTGVNSGDMIRVSAAKSINLSYSEIKAVHCAFHFENVQSFAIANMNVHGDSYGFMMYGSDPNAGTRTVKDSNFETMALAGIDESGTNGAITVTNCYFDTSAKLNLVDQQITVASPAGGEVPGVGPQ